MITDKDIQKLQTVFVTKNDLRDEFNSFENRMNEKLTDLRIDLMGLIMRSTKEILEELRSQRESWRNHDRRITRLEEKTGIRV